MTKSNKEKINYIETVVKDKGYKLNTFKLEEINGNIDVVWNISMQPHRVCEYFRQQNINIVPVKGMYGLTSLIFDADAFPNEFYKQVDNLPSMENTKQVIHKYDTCKKALNQLQKTYPTLVTLIINHFKKSSDEEIMDYLMNELNFKDIVTKIDEDTFLIELTVMQEEEDE